MRYGTIAPEEFDEVNPAGNAPSWKVEGESDDDADAAVGVSGFVVGVGAFDELAKPVFGLEKFWGELPLVMLMLGGLLGV